jgi:hypothetical protein
MEALVFVEHIDRELDLVCLLKSLLKSRHGIELKVANFYADAPLTLARPAPRLVVTPFFYATEDIVLRDYVTAWPDTRFVNLAWEQVFYPSHEQIKAPRDKFTRKQVVHLAWSRTFVQYLETNGVLPRNIRLVGNGLYRLYGPPYRDYFSGRQELAAAFGLDAAKRWVFVPENYRWAFFTDFKLARLGRRGVEQAELLQMRDYCRRSLRALVEWCDALGAAGEVEVILRPRPATNVAEIGAFIEEALGGRAPAFRVIKDRTAREWTLASDLVVSSYSTVLIEAALAGKAILRAAPEPTPEGLRYDWCDLAPEAKDQAAFLAACRAPEPAGGAPLRQWAEETFFPAGDPIERLVEALAAEVKAAYAEGGAPTSAPHGQTMPAWLAPLAAVASPALRHDLFKRHVVGYEFNRATHEKDLFTARDVAQRVRRWRTLAARAERLGVAVAPSKV